MNDELDNKTAPLIPIREQAINFYGDTIYAVLVEEGEEQRVYVPLKPISDALGLSWGSQYNRIQRDEVLSEVARLIFMTKIKPSRKGGRPDTLALPLEYLNGWLFGVQIKRVNEELFEKIKQYKRECYQALYRHFQGTALARRESGSPLAQIRELGLAIARQAEQQMLLEGRVETVEHRLDRAAEVVKTISQQQQATQEDLADLRELVDELADQVKALPAPGETRLTPEQKATIRGLVEDLVAAADARGAKLWGGKNNYQAAYATLNRTFNVAKYEELTQAQYPKAVEWLKREIARIEAQS